MSKSVFLAVEEVKITDGTTLTRGCVKSFWKKKLLSESFWNDDEGRNKDGYFLMQTGVVHEGEAAMWSCSCAEAQSG